MKNANIKVGDLVRMRGTIEWNGQIGLITKVPTTPTGMWVVMLTSGENTFVATGRRDKMKVINESR